MWKLAGGPPPARAAGRRLGEGVVVLDVDSTIVLAHSDKQGAAATYKHTYGFHPILVTCDHGNGGCGWRMRYVPLRSAGVSDPQHFCTRSRPRAHMVPTRPDI